MTRPMKSKVTEKSIIDGLKGFDWNAHFQRVLKSVAWKTRCRCSVCERLRANGEPGMDGISIPEAEGRGQS